MKTGLLLLMMAAAACAEEPGKATITIDVNGKKETRVVDLGKAAALLKSADAPKEKRMWIGVMVEQVSGDLRAQLTLPEGAGVVLREAVAGGPAAQAGLMKSDVITKLDDQLVFNAGQLRDLLQTKREGDALQVTYVRQGQARTAEVKVAAHESALEWGWGEHGSAALHEAIADATARAKEAARSIIMDGDRRIIIRHRDEEDDDDAEDTAKVVEKEMRKANIDEKTIGEVKTRVADALKRK